MFGWFLGNENNNKPVVNINAKKQTPANVILAQLESQLSLLDNFCKLPAVKIEQKEAKVASLLKEIITNLIELKKIDVKEAQVLWFKVIDIYKQHVDKAKKQAFLESISAIYDKALNKYFSKEFSQEDKVLAEAELRHFFTLLGFRKFVFAGDNQRFILEIPEQRLSEKEPQGGTIIFHQFNNLITSVSINYIEKLVTAKTPEKISEAKNGLLSLFNDCKNNVGIEKIEFLYLQLPVIFENLNVDKSQQQNIAKLLLAYLPHLDDAKKDKNIFSVAAKENTEQELTKLQVLNTSGEINVSALSNALKAIEESMRMLKDNSKKNKAEVEAQAIANNLDNINKQFLVDSKKYFEVAFKAYCLALCHQKETQNNAKELSDLIALCSQAYGKESVMELSKEAIDFVIDFEKYNASLIEDFTAIKTLITNAFSAYGEISWPEAKPLPEIVPIAKPSVEEKSIINVPAKPALSKEQQGLHDMLQPLLNILTGMKSLEDPVPEHIEVIFNKMDAFVADQQLEVQSKEALRKEAYEKVKEQLQQIAVFYAAALTGEMSEMAAQRLKQLFSLYRSHYLDTDVLAKIVAMQSANHNFFNHATPKLKELLRCYFPEKKCGEFAAAVNTVKFTEATQEAGILFLAENKDIFTKTFKSSAASLERRDALSSGLLTLLAEQVDDHFNYYTIQRAATTCEFLLKQNDAYAIKLCQSILSKVLLPRLQQRASDIDTFYQARYGCLLLLEKMESINSFSQEISSLKKLLKQSKPQKKQLAMVADFNDFFNN